MGCPLTSAVEGCCRRCSTRCQKHARRSARAPQLYQVGTRAVQHDSRATLSSMANLTIKVDDETLRRARIKALQEGTSVSRVLADYLEHFVEGDLQETGWAAFLARARSTTAASEHGRDWTRDELYRR
jgi:hypothetical protein